MTVKTLVEMLQTLPQDAEVVLEDSILGLAVKLTHVHAESAWQDGAVDLCGSALPETHWHDEDDDE